MTARLLSDVEAGAYCGVSRWAIRSWIDQGLIPVVKLPAVRNRRGGDLRRVLVDVRDLDQFVESHKEQG